MSDSSLSLENHCPEFCVHLAEVTEGTVVGPVLPHCMAISLDTAVAWEGAGEAEWVHRATHVLKREAS